MTQAELITKRLEGKIAVITGGNSGIGLATAQRFVQEGAYVFITGRRKDELDKAVKQIGRNVMGVQGDISNLADLDRVYDTIKQQKGRIDVLFANAGIIELAPLGSITESHFDKFSINVKGLLFAVQKGASAVSRCWFYHFNIFGRRIQRLRGVHCLQCNQGCYTIVRAFLDSRIERSQDPRQCRQSRSDRHTDDQRHGTE
jgi:NAD(P)-dependent dehydrogenase (short-subunit alcohol dehydrogenase family)